jgi:hypothetical protein
VIAYGQSGSGKTYTIFGPGLHCALSETEYGVVPRVTREIFSQLTVSVFQTIGILIMLYIFTCVTGLRQF